MTAPPLPERPPGPMRLVLSAYPTTDAAWTAVDDVLHRRLAACASIVPQESRYWWKGKVESSHEVLVVFKTAPKTVGSLLLRLKASHPYDVPEIAELNVERAEPVYLRWLAETLDPSSLRPNAPSARRRGGPRGPGARGPARTLRRRPRRSRRTGRRR